MLAKSFVLANNASLKRFLTSVTGHYSTNWRVCQWVDLANLSQINLFKVSQNLVCFLVVLRSICLEVCFLA